MFDNIEITFWGHKVRGIKKQKTLVSRPILLFRVHYIQAFFYTHGRSKTAANNQHI